LPAHKQITKLYTNQVSARSPGAVAELLILLFALIRNNERLLHTSGFTALPHLPRGLKPRQLSPGNTGKGYAFYKTVHCPKSEK